MCLQKYWGSGSHACNEDSYISLGNFLTVYALKHIRNRRATYALQEIWDIEGRKANKRHLCPQLGGLGRLQRMNTRKNIYTCQRAQGAKKLWKFRVTSMM